MKTVIILALIVAATQANILGRQQAAAARGILVCSGRPAANVKVKLYDEDDFGVDDKLQEGKTDSMGRFQLAGTTKEATPIDPKINIYHDCNDHLPCQRKFTIKIPNSYISSGKIAQKVYDAGTIELAGSFPGESRDCIN